MAIPESFIQTLVDRADIIEVVSKYVKLAKKGGTMFGLCPFHGEKSPSFSVSPDKQVFHCFGCSEGGGVIGFIMKIEGLNFAEAVKFIADMYGMDVPEDRGDVENQNKRKKILELNKAAARFYHSRLKTEQGQIALEYFSRRGLSQKTIVSFGLGYAPMEWDGLITAMTEQGFDKNLLFEARLVSKNKSGGFYDMFRNRVMFPIIDIRGDVIAFGGRVLDDSLPKYINSSDTPVYTKGRNLFAANIAKKTRRKSFILAEGYMDVIALHQAGFDNAVASLGTALTNEQAKLILRYTAEVVVCYDSDEAGQKATVRAMEILGRNGITVRVLKLGAKDPDDFIKQNGSEVFEKLLEKPQMGNEYRLETIKSKYALNLDDEKISYMREAISYIATIYSSVEREIFARNVANDVGISAATVISEIEKAHTGKRKKEEKSYEKAATSPIQLAQPKERELKYENVKSARAEERLLSLILIDDSFIKQAEEKIDQSMFSSPFLGKIYGNILAKFRENSTVSLNTLVNFLEPVEAAHLTAICTTYQRSSNSDRELNDYINTIYTEYLKNSEQDVLMEMIKNKRSGEDGRK